MNQKDIVLNDKLMFDLCKFIAFQSIRIPSFFDKQLAKSKQTISATKKDMIKELKDLPKDAKTIIIKKINEVKCDSNDYKKVLLSCLTNINLINKVANILLSNYCWAVFVNNFNNSLPFVTSDNPVIIGNLYTNEYGAYINGICSKGNVISIPINSNVIIQGMPNYVFGNMISNVKYKRYYLSKKDTNFIYRINERQVKQCYKEVYFHPKYLA